MEQIPSSTSRATPAPSSSSKSKPPLKEKLLFELTDYGAKKKKATFIRQRRPNRESKLITRARIVFENQGKRDAKEGKFSSPFFRTQQNHLIRLYEESSLEVFRKERQKREERERKEFGMKKGKGKGKDEGEGEGKGEEEETDAVRETSTGEEGHAKEGEESAMKEDRKKKGESTQDTLHRLYFERVAEYEKHIANSKGKERLKRLYNIQLTTQQYGEMKEEYLKNANLVDRREAGRIKSRKTKLRNKLESDPKDQRALSKMKYYDLTMDDLKRQKWPTRGPLAAVHVREIREKETIRPNIQIEKGQTSRQDRVKDIDLNRPAQDVEEEEEEDADNDDDDDIDNDAVADD